MHRHIEIATQHIQWIGQPSATVAATKRVSKLWKLIKRSFFSFNSSNPKSERYNENSQFTAFRQTSDSRQTHGNRPAESTCEWIEAYKCGAPENCWDESKTDKKTTCCRKLIVVQHITRPANSCTVMKAPKTIIIENIFIWMFNKDTNEWPLWYSSKIFHSIYERYSCQLSMRFGLSKFSVSICDSPSYRHAWIPSVRLCLTDIPFAIQLSVDLFQTKPNRLSMFVLHFAFHSDNGFGKQTFELCNLASMKF